MTQEHPTPTPVVIVDYDPHWPATFEEEKARILDVVGNAIIAIEHVGSTAVPGLGAKPIIDIMVGIRSLDDAQSCVKPLEGLGYRYIPEYEDEMPERRYFHKPNRENASRYEIDAQLVGELAYHLHMVETTSAFWERHLLFRNFLRTHPDVAHEYEVLKRHLAEQFGTDRVGYTEAKTPFIRAVEERARGMKSTKPSAKLSA